VTIPCTACGTGNRETAKFCRSCGKSLGAAPPPSLQPVATAAPPVHTNSGGEARPIVSPPIPKVPAGTVVREELRTPGTVLQTQRAELPLCGWFVILRGRRKGRDFRIEKETSILGRDGTCDYIIEDDLVSRQHVRIRIEDAKFIVFDLGSGNGTYLNGQQIQKAELQDGDVLTVGETLLLFKDAKPRIPIGQSGPQAGS